MPDFNNTHRPGSGKEVVDLSTILIPVFENEASDFSMNRASGDDVLGDYCERLMRYFARESGKSKAQCCTPLEISRVVAQIVGTRNARTRAAPPSTSPPAIWVPCSSSWQRGWCGHRVLRAGKECRNLQSRPHEHDPARQPRRARRARQRPHRPEAQGRRRPQDCQQSRRQSNFFRKLLSAGLDVLHAPCERFRPLCVPPGQEAGRLRSPVARRPLPEDHRQGRAASFPMAYSSMVTPGPTPTTIWRPGARGPRQERPSRGRLREVPIFLSPASRWTGGSRNAKLPRSRLLTMVCAGTCAPLAANPVSKRVLSSQGYEGPTNDIQQNRMVETGLALRPDDYQLQIAVLDYSMEDRVLGFRARGDFAGYVLRRPLVRCGVARATLGPGNVLPGASA